MTESGEELPEGDVKKYHKWWPPSALTPQFKVYVSIFLSSWGDRMWQFSGGLFLIEVTPGSFQLIAIYEAGLSLTVICLGAVVGRWVDRTHRLRAAQGSLILQNSMVCLCTVLLCLLISYKSVINNGPSVWLILAEAAVVLTGCFSKVGSLGNKLVIEKDWIAIISGKDSAKLATVNSVLRTVDLSTQMLAPVLVGFIIASSGIIIGGIVIAVWNVVSLIFEYGLLHHLYYSIPDLRLPKEWAAQNLDSRKTGKLAMLKSRLEDIYATWKKYFNHPVRNAGLGLALLYMTVLALDNFSRAYVYESGMSEGVLGILTACASFMGILGSLLFPLLNRLIGILKTGLFGFAYELFFLTFCVVAMFAPGTMFKPSALFNTQVLPAPNDYDINKNLTVFSSDVEMEYGITSNSTTLDSEVGNLTSPEVGKDDIQKKSYMSVYLLLTGIIASRLGLWMADLTVTQILLQEVSEEERGGINGVQFSLNQSFVLLRSVLLIILPSMATYGYLVMLSYLFVASANVSFSVYAKGTTKVVSKGFGANEVLIGSVAAIEGEDPMEAGVDHDVGSRRGSVGTIEGEDPMEAGVDHDVGSRRGSVGAIEGEDPMEAGVDHDVGSRQGSVGAIEGEDPMEAGVDHDVGSRRGSVGAIEGEDPMEAGVDHDVGSRRGSVGAIEGEDPMEAGVDHDVGSRRGSVGAIEGEDPMEAGVDHDVGSRRGSVGAIEGEDPMEAGVDHDVGSQRGSVGAIEGEDPMEAGVDHDVGSRRGSVADNDLGNSALSGLPEEDALVANDPKRYE